MMEQGKEQWNVMPPVLIVDDGTIRGERERIGDELDRVLAQLAALIRLTRLRAQPPRR